VRIGLTADLHYGIGHWVDRRVERFVEQTIQPAALDVLVVAGDVAEMDSLAGAQLGVCHRELLGTLRAAAGCPVAFCAGNHDIWCSDPQSDSWEVYRAILGEVAAATETVYLDQENLTLGDVALVGCYGHFDLSLRTPELSIAGERVTGDHYRRQTPPAHRQPVWMDGQKIHWPWGDAEACAEICTGGEQRLHAALDQHRKIVFVSHGVPRMELNGHRESHDPVSRFLNAFSGTSRLEALIRQAVARGAQVLSVSGHTHKTVARRTLEGVEYLNVGGTYGEPRLVIEEI